MSSATTLETRKLYTESVDTTDAQQIENIGKIASLWQRIALKKLNKLDKSSSEFRIFCVAENICLQIAQIAESLSMPDLGKKQEILLVKDDQKQDIHAIGLISFFHGDIEIDYLVTHPRNIRSSINEKEPDRIFGAGTCLINYLKQARMLATCSKITVCTWKMGTGFYEKLGFRKIEAEPCSLSFLEYVKG